MMKTLSLTLFLALSCSIGFAQNQQLIDSLKHELAIAKQDTSRMLILTDLCNMWTNANPDSAKFYGEKCISLSKQINFQKGEATVLILMGRLYRILGDIPKSMEYLFKAKQIAQDKNYKEELMATLSQIGITYANLSDYLKSKDYSLQAVRIMEENQINRINTYLNAISTLQKLGQIDTAIIYLNKARKLLNISTTNNLYKSNYFLQYGLIQRELSNSKSALENMHKALSLSQTTNEIRRVADVGNEMAGYFRQLNQPDSCIYYAKLALSEAQRVNYLIGISEAGLLLANVYDSTDVSQALYYRKIYDLANEKLFGKQKVIALQKTLLDEQNLQREAEAKRIAFENKQKQYALIAGLAIFLIIATILYLNNKQKLEANKVLENTLSNLKSTQAQLIQKEKLASLGELTAGIAHEIQNPLNFVNNFSELSMDLISELLEERNKEQGKRDEELEKDLLNDLAQNQTKINLHGKRASSIVKGMLEHSRTTTGERQLTDINQLADEYLRLAYHGLRAKDKDGSAARFNADYELITDEHLPKVEVVPQEIGRVLLNLLNNAFYAVHERAKQGETDYQPKVTVSTSTKDNQLEIRVKDNGIGMTEATKAKIFQPFFTTKPTGEGTGLGLSLAYDIVTKGHGGTIDCESIEGKGTTFIVKLSIKNS